jgi:hypothetical protein
MTGDDGSRPLRLTNVERFSHAPRRARGLYNLSPETQRLIASWGYDTSAANLKDQVRGLLGSDPVTIAQLADRTGARWQAVNGALRALIFAGEAKSIDCLPGLRRESGRCAFVASTPEGA